MSTNYYARIIPSKERKEELKKKIDENDFNSIEALTSELYSRPYFDYGKQTFVGGCVHLGHRAGGWKFLWNPNWYKKAKGHTEEVFHDGAVHTKYVSDGYDIFKYYDLNKESIKAFIDREDIVIYNEYNEKQDKEDFFNMALNWGKKDGYDHETYTEKHKDNFYYLSNLYVTDYMTFLKEQGFTLNKGNMDFYSDGLRFATTTDFS